jgi:hypothetical protein
LYKVDAQGELIGYESMSDNGTWLENDSVPDTVNPILEIFFEEMWPYLRDSIQALQSFVNSDLHMFGDELPRKTFTATPGFEDLQCNEGPLTVPFDIGGVRSRRMVVPYQMWMLQRVEAAMRGCDTATLTHWLSAFRHGEDMLTLHALLNDCRVKKQGGLLYSSDPNSD